jgi:hypothetical protein
MLHAFAQKENATMLHTLFNNSKSKTKKQNGNGNGNLVIGNLTKPETRIIGDLLEMLKYKRPANSPDVSLFIERFIEPVCNRHGGFYDDANNYIVKVGDDTRVMYSSHTDTVHYTGGTQRLSISNDYIKLQRDETSNCLGADCTTGVWLMLEMIRANVTGLYIFHASEEVGGLGSSYLVKNHPELVMGIDFCIAFDRKDITSIISHQVGGRCCSDEFCASLIKQMPSGYKIDTTGTFTDSANYTDLIAECTNISVGYYDQHTPKEMQSISHALCLREAMLRFDETKLVQKRIAGEIDIDYWGYPKSSQGRYKSYGLSNYNELYDFVRNNPDIVANFLDEQGYDLSYFSHDPYGRY